jgi:hypothetical protein
MLNKLVVFVRYAAGGGGLYIGLSQLHSDLPHAVAIACLGAVGVVGTLSFVTHVLLHEQDAKRIGFETKTVSFQYEVGFANLAFGITAIISYFGNWGLQVNTALILAYAIYLFQAGVLHTAKSLAGKKKDMTHLVRGGLITFAFSGAMLYVAFRSVTSSLF